MGLPRVLIIGGGFGGLAAAKALKKAPVEVLLIDKANYHLFQPLLYQVATATLSPGNIASPLREILANQANTTVLMADIVKIDKTQKLVIAANGESFKYDYLIIATGARHSYFAHPEWEALAPGLKTLNDALRIRERILLSYERAERCDSISQATKFLHFIIVGAGPTGVEMAGAIAEIAHETLTRNFRRIKPEQTKIYLIEGTDQVLPSYPKHLADIARTDLEKMGVEVLLNTMVTGVTSEGVWIGDKFIESSNIIWAAGNAASPLIQSLDTPVDKTGRAIVNADLTIPGHGNLFVIGDAALARDEAGNPLPAVAQTAIQQGNYVAEIIAKKVPKHLRRPFVYVNKGMMATIGNAKAVAIIGKRQLSGYFAWLIWCFIHILFLINFSNRFFVMVQWIHLYFSHHRRIRLITRPISDQDDSL